LDLDLCSERIGGLPDSAVGLGAAGVVAAVMAACAMVSAGAVGPLADWAYVYVNELGCGIVAYAASLEGLGCIAEDRGWNTLDAEVHCLGYDVLGVFGGVGGAAGAEGVVGFLRPVSTQDVDGAVGFANLGEHGVKDVEGAGVELAHFFIVAVAEEVIEIGESLGDVGVADAVDDVDDFVGVGVGELELVDLAVFGEIRVGLREQADAGQVGGDEGVCEGAETRVTRAAAGRGFACGCGFAGIGTEGRDG
jgi:hypothetical protein